MMQAAKEGLIKGTQPGAKVPELIAVTQLTSTSEEEMHHDQLINVPLETSVIHYAKCAEKAGLDGVVCSALEARGIQEATKQTFICLTPGIRPAGSAVGDQQRVVTPQHAREMGPHISLLADLLPKQKILMKPIKKSKRLERKVT